MRIGMFEFAILVIRLDRLLVWILKLAVLQILEYSVNPTPCRIRMRYTDDNLKKT